MDFYDFPFSWEYSSQLTNSYFSQGLKPPTSYMWDSNNPQSWLLMAAANILLKNSTKPEQMLQPNHCQFLGL
jgi:hypothetical protein